MADPFPWRAIGGSGRCGTSLLAERIATHPDVVYFQEPFWFCNRNRKVLAYMRGQVGPDELRKEMERSLRNLRAGFEQQGDLEMRERLEGQLPATVIRQAIDLAGLWPRHWVVRLCLARIAIIAGRRYWVEKSPHNVRNADWIVKVFPAARIVHVIREPKDICASLLHQDWGPPGPYEFVSWYRQVMTEALRARQGVPDGQYMVIEMETLVRQAHVELGRVMRFFGIEYDGEWLDAAASWIDPNRAHIGRAKGDLTPGTCEYIDATCGGLYRTWRGMVDG